MKRIFCYLLISAAICGISLSVTSCKDDDNDDNNGGGSEQTEGTMDAPQRFWNVASHLCSPFDVTADYENMVFEPTIGEEEQDGSYTRVVNASSLEVAVGMFNDITGADITTETDSYTFDDEAVGTLTYTKSTDGASLAAVDVDIKQIPHLQQIVFKTADQIGENAKKTGQPWYTFGDVISRPNADGQTEYWMCVHMTFTPQGQDDSQWVTLNALPSANVQNYVGSNGINYNMPTALGTSEAAMQCLAEMIYAVEEPEWWEENAKDAGCPKPFGDIEKENVKYINQDFWKRVRKAWNETGVTEKVFGLPWADLAIRMQNDGLHLLYKGYSWWFTWSDNCSLYEATYRSGGSYGYANAHNVSKREVKKEMIASKTTLDCVGQYKKQGWVNEKFFGDKGPRFIFRFATGKQLFGKKPNIYTTMEGKNGIKDEYVYTKTYNVPVADHVNMEQPRGLFVGEPFYHWGDVYVDEEGNHWIVTQQAGTGTEGACYSELMSLDAPRFSPDSAYVTNAPTKDEMLRGYTRLWYWSHSSYMRTSHQKDINLDHSSISGVVINNTMKVNVDPRLLLQMTLAEENARSNTEHVSIVYREGNDAKQRIMRLTMTSDLGKQDFYFNYWEHYPTQPSATAKYCTSFSSQPIYLQDVASQDQVDAYGKDYYATRQITWFKSYKGPERNYRTKADSTALRVSNYMYDHKKWYDAAYPAGMWNEPVIVVCFDAVKDFGPAKHETTTVKGRRLTPLHLVKIVEDEPDEDEVNSIDLSGFWNNLPPLIENTVRVDGKTIQIPSCQDVWEKK